VAGCGGRAWERDDDEFHVRACLPCPACLPACLACRSIDRRHVCMCLRSFTLLLASELAGRKRWRLASLFPAAMREASLACACVRVCVCVCVCVCVIGARLLFDAVTTGAKSRSINQSICLLTAHIGGPQHTHAHTRTTETERMGTAPSGRASCTHWSLARSHTLPLCGVCTGGG